MVKSIFNIKDDLLTVLTGRVKSYSEIINGELKRSSIYDDEGFEIERNYYKDGTIETTYKLNKYETGIYVTQQDYTRSINIEPFVVLRFDQNKNLINDRGNFIYEYDNNGEKRKKTTYYPNGEVEEISLYEYVGESKKIKNNYNSNGVFLHRSVKDYDKQGKIISWETFDGEGNSCDHSTYSYDSNGNEIANTIFNHGERMDTHLSEYDKNNRKIIEVHRNEHCGGDSITKFRYQLDSLNRILNQEETDQNGELLRELSYEYDNLSNIIKMVETDYFYRNDITETIFEISYHQNNP
jgi:hypothetical protein